MAVLQKIHGGRKGRLIWNCTAQINNVALHGIAKEGYK